MANVTDPLVSSVSGSDPQSLLEYITRQSIYESRFWKEDCFGLTVADVLDKAASSLQCVAGVGTGGRPTRFLALTLKLLQLHPETDLVVSSFVHQDEFKYVRALGCFYLRLTARPVDIYETLEPLYGDGRKIRVYLAPDWSLRHMDEFIHDLLTRSHVLGLALPRLPARRILQNAGYLPPGPRPTALTNVLDASPHHHDHDRDHDGTTIRRHTMGPLEYLEYKAKVEKSPAAMELWETRQGKVRLKALPVGVDGPEQLTQKEKPKERESNDDDVVSDERADHTSRNRREKRPKKKSRNYDNLFKKDQKSWTPSAIFSDVPTTSSSSGPPQEGSEEYWNEQRAKLGLSALK
jgi:pre-mRNA-splicing factor 38A